MGAPAPRCQHRAMEKLTTILAVSADATEAARVRARADALAAQFHAHVVTLQLDAGSDFPVHQRILDHVKLTGADLVVKVPAGPRSLRRFALGDTDWQLSRECPVPVLLARAETWATPVQLAAAIDVADEEHADLARAILHAAGFFALGARGQLDILYSEVEAQDEPLRMARAVRLAQLVREFHVGCERIQMFSGDPAKRLPPLIAARRYCVLVLGGRSRRAGMAQWSPGVVSRLMEACDSDILLINETVPAALAAFSPRAANAPATASLSS
jgi:hypothetical protein